MSQLDPSAGFLFAALTPAQWYNFGLVVVLLALAVAAVVGFRAWQDAHEDVEPVSTDELLASFEEARARGELDEEEYARVRQRLEQSTPRTPPARKSGPA